MTRHREDGCPFCAMAEHNDERIMVFEPLNPVTPGHMLVVPRLHVTDATSRPDITASVMTEAAKVAKAAGPCNIITSVGADATQTVFHLHVHVVPRRPGDGLALPWAPSTSPEPLREALDALADAFPVVDVSPGPWVVERGAIAWMVREGPRGAQIGNFILEADARFVADCRNRAALQEDPR